MNPSSPSVGLETIGMNRPTLGTSVPGGFWRRFLAAMLDGIIMGIVTVPMGVGFYLLSRVMGQGQGQDTMLGSLMIAQLVHMVFNSILVGSYYGWFYSKKGATPGKMLLRLKVVNMQTGTYMSFWNGFFRDTIGKMISAVILGIGYIMAGIRADKRALHDMMYDTQVILTGSHSPKL